MKIRALTESCPRCTCICTCVYTRAGSQGFVRENFGLTDCRIRGPYSGSKFLKSWMEFLEENADLRYPDLDDVLRDE